MIRLLLVEDDVALAKALSRAILRARPDYEVLTAVSGRDALSILESDRLDLVLTDLNMAEVDGFEVLAWVLGQRPGVQVLAMTGDSSPEARARLSALGAVDCLEKPVDPERLIAQLGERIAQGVHGEVHHLGLPSLLQVLELERKTCTLVVQSADAEGEPGRLFVREGALVDARLGPQRGDRAALTILAWPDVTVAIENRCLSAAPSIDKPAGYLIMEAMRLSDERARLRAAEPTGGERRLGREGPRGFSVLPVGTLALVVLDIESGSVLALDGREVERAELLAAGAAALLRQQASTLSALSSGEVIEEIVVSSESRCELLRPRGHTPSQALYLVFDPSETNLVIARLELSRVEAECDAWEVPSPPRAAVS